MKIFLGGQEGESIVCKQPNKQTLLLSPVNMLFAYLTKRAWKPLQKGAHVNLNHLTYSSMVKILTSYKIHRALCTTLMIDKTKLQVIIWFSNVVGFSYFLQRHRRHRRMASRSNNLGTCRS